MPSRRLHTKTRTGCSQCKQRRIKCDGTLPQCQNCMRRRYTSCSFLQCFQGPASNPDWIADLTTSPAFQLSNDLHAQAIMRSPQRHGIVPSLQPLLLPGPLGVQERGLLDHYITETSFSLWKSSTICQIWRRTFVEEAVAYDFVMHGLLALAAAHYKHIQHHHFSHYEKLTKHHFGQALRKTVPVFSSVTKVNCHALFASSNLITLLTFVSPFTKGNRIEDFLDFVTVLRGISPILENSKSVIMDGHFGPLLNRQWHGPKTALSPDVQCQFSRLGRLNESQEHDLSTKQIYARTIKSLEVIFKQFPVIMEDEGLVFLWLTIIEDNFLSCLQHREYMALTILAHYVVLLHSVEDFWWVAGRGRDLAESLHAALSPGWQKHISWALQFVQGNLKLRVENGVIVC